MDDCRTGEELNLVAEYSEFVIADGAGLECRDAFPDGKVTFVGAEGFTVITGWKSVCCRYDELPHSLFLG